MKTVIHPKYATLATAFTEVVNGNYTPDVVFCNKRNVVEKVTIEGKEFVVKRFKRPIFLNRIAYRFFRKSKARRAYEYAVRLRECDVDTPFPAAYFEFYKNGLFDRGIFISEYVPHKLLYRVYDQSVSETERRAVLDGFVDFMLTLHGKGIVPMDVNAGNIFYYKDARDGSYKFALTDINRMKFETTAGHHDMIFSFEQCFWEPEKMLDLAHAYNRRAGASVFETLHQILHHRIKRVRKAKYKKIVKK